MSSGGELLVASGVCSALAVIAFIINGILTLKAKNEQLDKFSDDMIDSRRELVTINKKLTAEKADLEDRLEYADRVNIANINLINEARDKVRRMEKGVGELYKLHVERLCRENTEKRERYEVTFK